MRYLIISIIALAISPSMLSAASATDPRIGVNVVNRFAGQSFFGGNFSTINPISTTMLELTYGNHRRNFYSALRFTTPLKPEGIPFQLQSVQAFYSQTSKLGFSLGGGYGLGNVNAETGRGSSLMITTAMVFDFNIYNKFFDVTDDDTPGFLTWGLELMFRYNFHFSKYTAFVIGFDIGYSLSAYKKEKNIEIFDINLGKQIDFIHYMTFGGVIGFRF
ncbi:MAG: hypothetical protein ACRCVW_05355 [Brevinema sp.]